MLSSHFGSAPYLYAILRREGQEIWYTLRNSSYWEVYFLFFSFWVVLWEFCTMGSDRTAPSLFTHLCIFSSSNFKSTWVKFVMLVYFWMCSLPQKQSFTWRGGESSLSWQLSITSIPSVTGGTLCQLPLSALRFPCDLSWHNAWACCHKHWDHVYNRLAVPRK